MQPLGQANAVSATERKAATAIANSDLRVTALPNMSRLWDSNPQPPLYKSGALPIAPSRQDLEILANNDLKTLLREFAQITARVYS